MKRMTDISSSDNGSNSNSVGTRGYSGYHHNNPHHHLNSRTGSSSSASNGGGLNHYHRGSAAGGISGGGGSRQNNSLSSTEAPTIINSAEQQHYSHGNINNYRGSGGVTKNTGSGGTNATNTPYRGSVEGVNGRGGGGNSNNLNNAGDNKFSNSNTAAGAAAHREREMLSIYGGGGGGGGNVTSGSGHGSISSGDPDGPNKSNNFLHHHNNDSFDARSGLTDPTGQQLIHKRKYHNPCRFTGHDHDWKDCPNNFRNKKKLRTVVPGRGGAAAGGGVGFDRGIVGGGRGAYNHHGGAGPGGMSFMESDQTTLGHYGPAAVQSSGGNDHVHRGGGGAGIDRNVPVELDRVGAVERGASAGDRGYDISSSLMGSRSKSFGDDPSHRGEVFGSVGGRTSSSGSLFSPKPSILGERQQTWHHGGERGGVDNVFTPQPVHQQQLGGGIKSMNPVDSTTISPSSNKPLLDQKSRHHAPQTYVTHQQHRQTQLPHQQQSLPRSSSTSSPIMSMKNERGYSFTPPATLNRSRSAGNDQTGNAGGMVGYHSHRNTDTSSSASPGEVRGAERKLMSKENEGGRSFAGVRESAAENTPRVDSLYADLASPSPWSINRHPVVTVSSVLSPQCTSPKLVRERSPFTSPGELLVAGDQHPVSTSEYTSANRSDSSMPPPTPASVIENKNKANAEKGMSQLPSLTCSSLVESDKIRKAENIVAAMVKLAAFESIDREEGGVGVPLPSKLQITRAMGILETKIKLKTEEAEAVRKEVKSIQIEEKEKEELLNKIEVEEGARIAKEEKEQIRRMQNKYDTQRAEREVSMSKTLSEFCIRYEARKSALQEKRQAEILRMKELCQSDIQDKVSGIDSRVFTLNDQLREAQRQIAELDRKQRDFKISENNFPYEMTLNSADGASLGPLEVIAEDEMKKFIRTLALDLPEKMSGLVANIIAQNQMIAKRSHLKALEGIAYFPDAEDESNSSISNQVWSNRARRVTGQFDALYTEPTEVPYYHENNDHFIEIAPIIKDCIRRKNEKLKSRWTMLAEHYVLRQRMHSEQTGMTGDMSERGGHFSGAGWLLGGRGASYDAMNKMESSSTSTPNSKKGIVGGSGNASQPNEVVRGNNPYRRPRRGISLGDVVRSDYEQEQIIAEIAAKEAMEKRIKEGGCALPRQRGWLENRLFASCTDGFFGQRVFDPLADEEDRRNINIWSDMEKCIFLDRFLQHPKDFRRIASFLKYKTTKDCIAFYYHSKKTVPYKHALKEHMQRKKCRGDAVPWDATIQACLSMGAVVKAGSGPERPLKFVLPESDFTYHSRNFHPMRLEVFNNLHEMISNAKQRDDGKAHFGKRKRSNWFILDVHEKKYLRHGEINDDHHSSKRKFLAPATDTNSDDGDSSIKSNTTRAKSNKLDKGHSNVQRDREVGEKHQNEEQQSHKPQKWKAKEKELFFHALNKFGHDWSAVAGAVGTRTHTQVKNYFYDNKKTIAKQKEKSGKAEALLAKQLVDAVGKKNKKSKTLGKTVESEGSKKDVAPKTISLTTDAMASTDSSNSETESGFIAQETREDDQLERYRQHQFRLHQQQHLDQLRLQHQQQQHFQQQQHIERLMHHQRQEDLYRRQIQQEEMYRQHLRQQEMMQVAQHAQQLQHNQLHASANRVGHQQLVRSFLALRNADYSPHLHHQNQVSSYGNAGGSGQQQQQQHSDLERVYKAALTAGVPISTLESALAAARGGDENPQQQAVSIELLRRLGYGDEHYQR